MDPKKLQKITTQPTIQEVFVRNIKNKNINKESKSLTSDIHFMEQKANFPF